MKPATRRYYAELKADYAVKIRQLVPRYDEMVECTVDLLETRAERREWIEHNLALVNSAFNLSEQRKPARERALA